jgi:hypothetical protein
LRCLSQWVGGVNIRPAPKLADEDCSATMARCDGVSLPAVPENPEVNLPIRHPQKLRACAGRLHDFLLPEFGWRTRSRWLAYLPFSSYLLFLMVRHRSMTLFTAANPGISSGGVVGESKSRSLGLLSRVDGAVADFFVVHRGSGVPAMMRDAQSGMAAIGLAFPVVLKPDVGERGYRVAVIHSEKDMKRYFGSATGSVIVQRLVDGIECGIFYCRHPDEAYGRIVSIAETRFPRVEGDGCHTLDELIRQQRQSARMAAARSLIAPARLREVPANGQRVRLVELGFSCTQALFLDRCGWKTPALERAIEAISRAHPGFHIGRFDVCASSVEALQRGEFKVIELNGVIAAATHIYDPAGTLAGALRVLLRQWRAAFEIGAANRARGARPMASGELALLLWRKFRG